MNAEEFMAEYDWSNWQKDVPREKWALDLSKKVFASAMICQNKVKYLEIGDSDGFAIASLIWSEKEIEKIFLCENRKQYSDEIEKKITRVSPANLATDFDIIVAQRDFFNKNFDGIVQNKNADIIIFNNERAFFYHALQRKGYIMDEEKKDVQENKKDDAALRIEAQWKRFNEVHMETMRLAFLPEVKAEYDKYKTALDKQQDAAIAEIQNLSKIALESISSFETKIKNNEAELAKNRDEIKTLREKNAALEKDVANVNSMILKGANVQISFGK